MLYSFCVYCNILYEFDENRELCQFCQHKLYQNESLYEELNNCGTWEVCCSKEERCSQSQATLLLGRDSQETKFFCGNFVSKNHALCTVIDSKIQITDCQSTNGTFILNNEHQWSEIKKQASVPSGSFIRLSFETILQVWIKWKSKEQTLDYIENDAKNDTLNIIKIENDSSFYLEDINRVKCACIYQTKEGAFIQAYNSNVLLNSHTFFVSPLYIGDRIYCSSTVYEYWKTELRICKVSSPPNIILNNIEQKHRLYIDKLTFSAGKFIGIVGSSGAGKSTLLHILTQWNHVSYNQLQTIVKNEIQNITPLYVPQYDIVHDSLTVYDCLYYTCLLFDSKSSATNITRKIYENLKRVHLEHKANSLIHTLSGGQRKRINIANVLISKNSSYIILDEPTSGLDATQDYHIMKLLSHFAEQGRTIICTTHNLYNIQQCDAIIQLEEGRVLYTGKPTEWLASKNVTIENTHQLYKNQDETVDNTDYSNTSYSLLLRSAWWILLKRRFKEHLFTKKCLKYWLSLLMIPLIIGLLIHCALEDAEETRLFLCSVSSFWLGMSLSSTELCLKRFKIMLHEKVSGISSLSFFISYSLYYIIINCIQTLLLILPTFYLLYTKQSFNQQFYITSYITFFLLSWLLGISGSFCGLSCSLIESDGLFHKWSFSTAMTVPFFTVWQLIFSELLMGATVGSSIEYFVYKFDTLRQYFYHITFSRYADMAYKAYYNNFYIASWQFYANIGVLIIISILLPAIYFYHKLNSCQANEKYL